MKKGFAILLSVFILLQSGVMTFHYALRVSNHKKYISKALHSGQFDSRLVSIRASETKGLKWENEHEFVIGSEKYDIVKTSFKDGEMVYHCINDKDEKKLIGKMAGSEKKSGEIEDILKKLKLQINLPFNKCLFEQTDASEKGMVYMQSRYKYLFLHAVYRPPLV